MLMESIDCSGPAAVPGVPVAHVNSVPLNPLGQVLTPTELRQRACTELLRQAAVQAGLLDAAGGAQ